MGQKVNPKGFRIGVYRDWDARWFARRDYAQLVLEDIKIRTFIDTFLKNAEVARVEIEKDDGKVRVIIHAGRVGTVIGKKGQDIDHLRNEIRKILGSKKMVEVSVQEVKNVDLDATLVAKSIAEQLERRISFKKAMKRSVTNTMRVGGKGIKICCSGRLNGAEIARSEWMRVGSTPLHTLRADIDYGFARAETTYGTIGVKVWICRGEYQFAH